MQRSAIPSSLKSKGTYILFLFLEKDQCIRIGRLGRIHFRRGYYMYVGSAMNGLYGRLKRYLNGVKKRHWHIDYLIEVARLRAVLVIPSDVRLEEYVAWRLSQVFESIRGFGSTDSKLTSHLFYVGQSVKNSKTILSKGNLVS